MEIQEKRSDALNYIDSSIQEAQVDVEIANWKYIVPISIMPKHEVSEEDFIKYLLSAKLQRNFTRINDVRSFSYDELLEFIYSEILKYRKEQEELDQLDDHEKKKFKVNEKYLKILYDLFNIL